VAARKKSRADWQVNSTHISVQALNEFVAVCKKCGKDGETADQLANATANASSVHEITLSTYRIAQVLATRY